MSLTLVNYRVDLDFISITRGASLVTSLVIYSAKVARASLALKSIYRRLYPRATIPLITHAIAIVLGLLNEEKY